MSNDRPSLEAQAIRWLELNDGGEAIMARELARALVATCRKNGLRIEILNVPDGDPRMGGHREVIIVTPSREGYQSTT